MDGVFKEDPFPGNGGCSLNVDKFQVGMKECEDKILEYLKKLTPPGKCPLGGNSVGQV
jgi:oligoribonuclease (3'-5' exoribonuclease)